MDKNKANVPKIRFPGFAEEWEERKLGEVVDIIGTGKSKFISNIQQTEEALYAVLGSTSVISYDEEYDYSGDFILTARVGVNAGDLYRYAGNVKISDNTVFLQSKDSDFIYYLLAKFNLKNLAFGTGQPLIKVSELSSIDLMFPCEIEENKQIGSFFYHIDNLIALHQRKLNHLQGKKKGLLQKMFPKDGEDVPELRFLGFTDAWKKHELGEIGSTYTGLSGKSKDDFGHGKGKYVTYMNVYSNTIADLSQTDAIEIDEKQNEVKRGDIFFTTSSETPDEVGMSSVWIDNGSNIYLNSFCFGYRLVLHPPNIQSKTGYNLFNFILASWVLNCQFIFTHSAFRFIVQILTFRLKLSISGHGLASA